MSEHGFSQLAGLENTFDQIQKIAIGGMAELYRGRQKALDRPVAIKRIKPELRGNEEIKKRFQREARAAANLLHHNLAHVYDYIEHESESYIIMEFIDGFDLSDLIAKAGPIPADVAMMIATQALIGLSYIHSHGMVHRDIKPDNIRVSTRGEIKIMDFGIAYDPGEGNLTRPGMLVGSPHYLSPEQITGSKIDSRADLFSFGITFYEMLTGTKPFMESQNQTIFNAIQQGTYTPIEKFRSDLNPYVTRTVENCLEIDLSKRASSSLRLAESLQSYVIQNYSVSPDARIKQFLVQSSMLKGSASIEISEKTFDTPIQSSKDHGGKWIILIAIVVALGIGFLLFKGLEHFKTKSTIEPTSAESVMPKGQDKNP
ncbi:serine/threonine protein kinase [bacterium]|nr:serine/threonine protein kinase [bacterium]